MDEIGNSGSYQPPSSVMESPLMQLANASVSVMRANLSPKEIKNSGVESKINPSTHSTSCSVNTDPHIPHPSNSSIDSFTKTHVPIEGTVSSTNNPLPDKIIKNSCNASFILVGSKNPVLEDISASQISKDGNISTQLTRGNSEFLTQESDSHKEPKRSLLPIDGTIVNVTKSVGMILTSKPSESMFTTSDRVSTIATKDAVSKRTDSPKEETLSPPTIPSQINPTNSQTESVPVKTPKLTTCKNEKSISLLPSETIPKTKYTAVQNLQSVPLAKKDAKPLVNPNLVTEESLKDTNCSPQIKHVSNVGVTPVSNMCTLPSNTPLILPVTASSTLTEIESHSRSLLQSHTIAQPCTTHSILNKHSYLRESQNTSENVKFTSDIIPNNISVNVPTRHTLVPSASPMPFPAKSDACVSPCTIAVATDISVKKPNQSNTHFSSVNLVSKISSPLSKQLNKSDKKDKVVQAKAAIVEIPSKRSFPLTFANVSCCSYGQVNTLSASNSSLAQTNLVSVCTVDSAVAFSTPAVNTTASASASKCNPDNVTHTLSTSATNSATFSTSVASCNPDNVTHTLSTSATNSATFSTSVASCNPDNVTHTLSTSATNSATFSTSVASCNPDNVTHTLSTSATNSATFSTSVASCTLSVSNCPPIICPHKVTGSLTAASSTTLPSAALCLSSSLSTDTLPPSPTTYASVSSVNLPLTTPCSSTSMHTSCIATSSHITSNTTSANTIVSSNTSIQSSKKVTDLQEYEIRSNKSDVNNSKNVAKKQPCFQDPNLLINVTKSHTCMSHFIGGQSSGVENSNKQNQYLLTTAIMKPLPSIDSKKHVSEVSSSFNTSKEAPASITGTQAPASITGDEVPTSIVETKAPTSIVRTKAPSTIERTEIPSTIDKIKAPSTIDGTKAPSTIDGTKVPSATGGTKAPSATGGTKAPSATGGTKAPSATGGTKAPSATGGTKAPSATGGTKAPSATGGTKAPSATGGTKAPSATRGTKAPSATRGTKVPSAIGGTKAPSTIGGTKAPSAIGGTKAPSAIGDTKAPSAIEGTKAPSAIGDTKAPSTIGDTKAPSTIDETKAPSTIDETKAPSTIDETKVSSTIDETKVSSSNLNQFVSLAPDESVVTNIKHSSDKKVIGCKSRSDQLSKNVLTKIEAKMDSSVKQCSSTRITETSDGMTTVSSSLDKSVPCSSQQSASVSMIGNAVSVVGDTTKKNLKNKNTSSSVQSVNSDKSELVPLRKKSVKKSKSPGKESKSHHTGSKTSNSALSSVTGNEDPVCSDLHKVSTNHPKLTNVVKGNSTISSNEKKKSSISTMNTAISTKESTPIKTEESSISTRPRRTIKTRHLFSSSSYSTGSIKSEAAGENSSSSSSNKQRKRTIAQSSDEEKKSSNNASKKSHINKTATDEETSPLKKPVRRRSILPAVKSDSADASKNCLLIKTSPNVAQVPSDTPPSTGYTYLLTALSLTTAEKDSGKMVKTPTMASNSGVTSTSPTYSSSKRNVTTKCSTTKEEKSSERTVGQTEKTCPDSLISSPRTSISHKSWDTSPVNDTDNTSDESLEGANESDTLQNSAESRKRKKSTSDVSAASDSPSLKSCDDLSQQIAEAEKFIKKEPIEVSEVDQTVVENNAEATSQNSSVVGAPSRETCEIRKLLNAGCSNTQTPLVQDLISPNSGNNFSQTRPLAPVQLSSPYAIFLPVSLASGATTTVTAPPTSTPLYSIQLNVPNVVRMGKPFLSNDGSITKKHCTTIPATTGSKTDSNSSLKSNLISRNNQIATYYPAPLPESLMNKITVNYHACAECGDTFLFKSSLNAHKTRKCMQLTYNCDNCTMKLVFYNKCSVLEHIRSHYPTRPVTIKLDRMEVMPLPEGITDVLEMEDRSKEEKDSVRDTEEASKFDCTECGAKFHSARPLAEHFGHSEMFCSFTFYCALCQTYLPRHCAQLAHRRLHHEKPPHVCPECGQLIPNLFTFREHLKYKCMHFSRVAPLTCPKCMSKFCYTPELKEHIINVHSETFIKCSICPMAFKASASYQTHHQNTHASEAEQKKEIYKCPLCDTVFHSIQQLMNHVDFHIGELKVGIRYAFRCSMCICIFAKRSQLVSHLSSTHHVDYLQHRCEFCDCVCKTAHNLQTHQRAIHKVELKKYELLKGNKMKGESAAVKSKKMKDGDVTHCSLCHIFFATLAQLQMHTTKVHQRKMDSPPDSGTTSEQSSSSASKNKNSQKFCRYCKAPYKSWSRLMQHILGHRNSGVYICLICTSAAFVSKEELSKHEEFCSGENLQGKPPAVYECEECHQLFKQESWLIAHQKNIHPKKGTLSCDLSGVSNKSNSSPQKNTQVVNEGKKSFSCYVCKELNKEKIFRCQSQLEKHLMTKHKMSLKQMKIKQSGVDEKNNKNSSCLSQESSDKNKQAALKNVDVVPTKKAKLATPKEETYICAKCNFTNQNFYIFQLHIQEHKTSDDGFQCTTCGLCFAVVDSLRMHLFAVHKIKRSNDSLRDEGGSKSPVSKVIEETDSSPIVQSPVINTPLKVTAPEIKTTVAIEPKTVVESVKITSDSNSDSNLLPCQCNVCYKMFETEHLLKVHMRTHGMAFIRSKRLTMSE